MSAASPIHRADHPSAADLARRALPLLARYSVLEEQTKATPSTDYRPLHHDTECAWRAFVRAARLVPGLSHTHHHSLPRQVRELAGAK